MKYSSISYILLLAAFVHSTSSAAPSTTDVPGTVVTTQASATEANGTTQALPANQTSATPPNKTTEAPEAQTSSAPPMQNNGTTQAPGSDTTTPVLEVTTLNDIGTPEAETSATPCDNTTENCNTTTSTPLTTGAVSTPCNSTVENCTTTSSAPSTTKGTVAPPVTDVNPDMTITTTMPEDMTTIIMDMTTILPNVASSTVAPDTTSNATPTQAPDTTKQPMKTTTAKPTESPKPADKTTEPAKLPTTGALTTKSGEPEKLPHHGNSSVVVGLVVTALLLVLIAGVFIFIRQRKLRNSYGRLNEESEDSGWSAFSKNPIYRGDRDYQLL